jgi:PEP-CTERM motif
MKTRLLSSVVAAAVALVVPHAASAATIINIGTTSGSLTLVDLSTATGPALNLVNASSPYQNNLNRAFIFNEGMIGGLQSFLLHFDDAPGNPQGRVTGSFVIQLAQGETLGVVSRTVAELIATDRVAGALYSTNGNRGLETNGNGIDLLTVTLNGLLATVNFDLRANQALDNVRFDINRAVAVPEPATWLMLLAGFGLMGVALRRRRRIQLTYS